MHLTRHATPAGSRWALNGKYLVPAASLGLLLQLPAAAIPAMAREWVTGEPATGPLLPPIEPEQEVWAGGVTYLRSRDARQAESAVADVYTRVYDAPRPEIFFKAPGWRVVGPGQPIRIRRDSQWNVPEPELTLVINRHGEIVGFCAGNDVSSRDIEGANPLYLPQAKVYNGSCALGPAVKLARVGELTDLTITVEIERKGQNVFRGSTRTSLMKRTLPELVDALYAELDFPQGAFLMTGTGTVPPEDYTLLPGDRVRVAVDTLVLENETEA